MGSCGLCVQGVLCADVQSLLCVVLVACMLCRSQLLFRGTNTTGAFFGMTALAGTPGGLNNTVIVISQPALRTAPVGATAFRGRIFGGCPTDPSPRCGFSAC